MYKHQIYVHIRSEEDFKKAKIIILKAGEEIRNDFLFKQRENYFVFSIFLNKWIIINDSNLGLKEISLTGLANILKIESNERIYCSFFKFMNKEHNLTLLDSEMHQIIHEAKKVIKMEQENRGGNRKGAGRKAIYDEPTVAVGFRCPKSKRFEFGFEAKKILAKWEKKIAKVKK